MRWLLQRLRVLIAGSTDSHLARRVEFLVEFLKAENTILRKRLLDPSAGPASAGITVVSSQTYRRWVRQNDLTAAGVIPWAPRPRRRQGGRARDPQHIKELVLRTAGENANWGYTRILGELGKLGVKFSRSTAVNILRELEFDPKLDPTKGSWANFLRSHAESLWAV